MLRGDAGRVKGGTPRKLPRLRESLRYCATVGAAKRGLGAVRQQSENLLRFSARSYECRSRRGKLCPGCRW